MREDKWEKINVVFKLKSPLHIGYMPFKGSVVSPTRYYVPGRNLWGAITKGVTEHLYEKPEANDYQEIGRQVMKNFRFSYFYLYDGGTIYFPHYTNEGLKYGELTKSEFEHRFIGSIVSTEIEDKTRTAKDKSLHEIEFINNRYRDKNGKIVPVMIAGCIWVKKDAKINNKDLKPDNGIFIDDFNIISELILGGESKYGFGYVRFASEAEFSKTAPFKWGDNPEEIEIKQGEPLVAHLKYNKNKKFEGDIELLIGRGYFNPEDLKNNDKKIRASDRPGEIVSKPKYYFSPGTVLKSQTTCIINWDGSFSKSN